MATARAGRERRCWSGVAHSAVVALGLMALAVVVVGWWGIRHGYLAPEPRVGGACVFNTYYHQPTYDELVNEYGYSPFCARVELNETWYGWPPK